MIYGFTIKKGTNLSNSAAKMRTILQLSMSYSVHKYDLFAQI